MPNEPTTKDDWGLETQTTTKKKRARKPPEDWTSTERVEAEFKEAFRKRYGCPIDGPGIGDLLYKPARDRKLLKNLVASVGEDEAVALIHDFFFRFDKDRHVRFLTRSGNVLDFQKCLSRLVVLRNGGLHDAPDRITDNEREIDKARRPR